MNIKKFFKIALGITMATTVATSCVQKDDWDTPAFKCENKFGEPTKSMADVAALAPNSGYHLIEDNVIFDGYVVSSDEQGNFYKTISFQDSPINPTVGLQLSVDKSDNFADFPVGTHIRINAKGLRIAKDKGVLKIGTVDNQYTVGRIPAVLLPNYVSGVCNGTGLDIKEIVPTELPNLDEAKKASRINTLVTIAKVQFNKDLITPDHAKYVELVNGESQDTDREIQDKFGNTVNIRTSGFADFKSELLPQGSGKITFVVSRYNSNWQMYLRDLNDVEISDDLGTRFEFDITPPKGGSQATFLGNFTENFESYNGGWSSLPKYYNDPVEGDRYWKVGDFGNNKYIQINAYNATGAIKTSFAVPVDFSAANSMSFDSKYGYFNGHPLKVYLSTDYTPIGSITAATLTDITAQFIYPGQPTTGNYNENFVNSGTYNFPANLTGNGYIIFVYEGGNGVTTTVQIDNIMVQ